MKLTRAIMRLRQLKDSRRGDGPIITDAFNTMIDAAEDMILISDEVKRGTIDAVKMLSMWDNDYMMDNK